MSLQKALVITEVGKPLSISTRSIPSPKGNEILIKVSVAGINPLAQKQRDYGFFLDTGLPASLLNDLAGIVTSVGPEVTKFKPGDIVFGQASLLASYDFRGSQEYALLDELATFHEPQKISAGAATTLLSNFFPAIVAFFGSQGFQFPLPGSEDSASFDFASHVLVVIGGGTSTGMLGVQLARLVGIGTIIVVASPSSTTALRKFGATHVIDRRDADEKIKGLISKICSGRELLTVYDTYNSDHTLAVSLLSEKKQGKVVGLVPSQGVDQSKIGTKSAGYDIQFARGSIHAVYDTLGKWFVDILPEWIESGKIEPTPYKDLGHGLDADAVNKVFDDYRDGRNPGRYHIHPNVGL